MSMNIDFSDSEYLDVLNSFFDEGERAAAVAALSFCRKFYRKT